MLNYFSQIKIIILYYSTKDTHVKFRNAYPLIHKRINVSFILL